MTTSTIDMAGLKGGRVNLMAEQLDELEALVDGPLLRAGDEGWNDAVLVWNGMVARFPALVLQPTSARDVAAAVRFVRDHGLSLRPALVRYHTTQQGMPDAAHERHFEPAAEGLNYRLMVQFEPRAGLAGLFDRTLLRYAAARALRLTLRNLTRELRAPTA